MDRGAPGAREGEGMSASAKARRHFLYREAVRTAGEVYCCDPDPKGGSIICTRPAGHTGRHAAHGNDPDVPLWTWARAPSRSEGGGTP